MEFAIFVIGVSLIVVGFLLTFLNKATLQATIGVVLGSLALWRERVSCHPLKEVA